MQIEALKKKLYVLASLFLDLTSLLILNVVVIDICLMTFIG